MYSLNVRDLCATRDTQSKSGFELYRKRLHAVLKQNKEFFRDRIMDVLQSPVPGSRELISHGEFYLRIQINLVPHEVPAPTGFHSGINVSVTSPPLEPVTQEEIGGSKLDQDVLESLKCLACDKSQVDSFKRWRTCLKQRANDYTGIGIAVDFTVHYPLNRVHFWVQMGLPFMEVEISRLKPRLSRWQNKISRAFGDFSKPAEAEDGVILKYLEQLHRDTISEIDLSDVPTEQIWRLHEHLKRHKQPDDQRSAVLKRLEREPREIRHLLPGSFRTKDPKNRR